MVFLCSILSIVSDCVANEVHTDNLKATRGYRVDTSALAMPNKTQFVTPQMIEGVGRRSHRLLVQHSARDPFCSTWIYRFLAQLGVASRFFRPASCLATITSDTKTQKSTHTVFYCLTTLKRSAHDVPTRRIPQRPLARVRWPLRADAGPIVFLQIINLRRLGGAELLLHVLEILQTSRHR